MTKNYNKKIKILFISIVFCLICIYRVQPTLQLKSHQTETQVLKKQINTGLIIFTTVDDPVIEVIQETLKETNYYWLVKSINNENDIENEIIHFSGLYVVLIGHGSPEGLQLRNGVWFWSKISRVYDNSPAKFFFTAACYSAQIDTFSSKKTFGFTEVIDSYIAAKDIGRTISLGPDKIRTITNFQSSDHDPLYEYRKINPRKDFVLANYYTIKIAATNGLVDHLQAPWYEGGMDWGSNWDENLEEFVEESLAIFEPNFGIEFDVIEVVEIETEWSTHADVMQDAHDSI